VNISAQEAKAQKFGKEGGRQKKEGKGVNRRSMRTWVFKGGGTENQEEKKKRRKKETKESRGKRKTRSDKNVGSKGP